LYHVHDLYSMIQMIAELQIGLDSLK
jgi:hypothetical protein